LNTSREEGEVRRIGVRYFPFSPGSFFPLPLIWMRYGSA
jgi:hypothetical protein